MSSVTSEIERYLRTGRTDPNVATWPGDSPRERWRNSHNDLRDALLTELRRRTSGTARVDLPDPIAVRSLTRERCEPMVRGLFPRAEQDVVLNLVQDSVVFLGPENIEAILTEESFHKTAWDLANLYLRSFDAELLGPDAPDIVGMSEGTTCFLSHRYFDEHGRFDDFLVHEVAHIFHNCKRARVGLPFSRRKEWLLDIAFRKRETFAFACEVFACISRTARNKAERVVLAASLADTWTCPDERVDHAEIIAILTDAAESRNGWKVILSRCAPARR